VGGRHYTWAVHTAPTALPAPAVEEKPLPRVTPKPLECSLNSKARPPLKPPAMAPVRAATCDVGVSQRNGRFCF